MKTGMTDDMAKASCLCVKCFKPKERGMIACQDCIKNELQIKKGDRFLHAKWINSVFSMEEIKRLPREETALEFQVTAIRQGWCYYRPVYRYGDREELGSPMKHPIERMNAIIMKMTKEAKAEGKQ